MNCLHAAWCWPQVFVGCVKLKERVFREVGDRRNRVCTKDAKSDSVSVQIFVLTSQSPENIIIKSGCPSIISCKSVLMSICAVYSKLDQEEAL